MSRIMKTTALIALSLVVALAICEGILRVTTMFPITGIPRGMEDPVLLYRLNQKFFDVNEDGFRGSPSVLPASISAIGDSLTFGWGVDSSDSWPAHLELLSGESVYNFGVISYNIYQYYSLAEAALQKGVDEIIIGFYPSNDLRLHVCEILELEHWRTLLEKENIPRLDCSDHVRSYYQNIFIKGTGLGAAESLLLQVNKYSAVSSLAHYVATTKMRPSYDEGKHLLVGDIPLAKWRLKARIYETSLDDEFVRASYSNSEKLFLKMKASADERGVRFMVLVIPSKFQVVRNWALDNTVKIPLLVEESATSIQRLEDRYLEFFSESNIPALTASEELLTVFAEAMHNGMSLYEVDDDHPSKAGYLAIAKAAARLRIKSTGRKGGSGGTD